MKRGWIVAALLLAACASVPRPYRDLRNPRVRDPWLTLEHQPGYMIVPTQSAWVLRIGQDGVVERDEHRGCDWETIALRPLSVAQVEELRVLAGQLEATPSPGTTVEDAPLDVILVGELRAQIWDSGDRARNQGRENFIALWNRVTTWFPAPRAARASCN